MALTNNKGQESSKNKYSQKQLKSHSTCLIALKGLTIKEAERILLDLLSDIKGKAKIN